MDMNEVDGFEKDDGFSEVWNVHTKEPIQATFWGIDGTGGIHSFATENVARECAEHTDYIVFIAELAPPS